MGYLEVIGGIIAILLAGIAVYDRKRQAKKVVQSQESADRIESDPVGEFMLRYKRTGREKPTDTTPKP
jgi:hypothetical protein